MKLLITGASGLFGSKLAQLASLKQHEVYSAINRSRISYGIPIQLDVTDRNQVNAAFKKANPEVVIHAASLTDVDKCENEKKLAWKINVEGTENIAKAAQKENSFLLYISTDYVFDGKKGCYAETDTPNPINHYGTTKLKAEEKIKQITSTCCIARTSVIYGSIPAAGKVNFALWLLNKLQNNQPAPTAVDQWNSPTLNTSLAEMTLEIVERKLAGTYHLSGATRISRHDFAKNLAETFDLNTDLLIPKTSAEFQWKAKRPQDSSLNTTKAEQKLRSKPLKIDEAFKKLKNELGRARENKTLASKSRSQPGENKRDY